MDAPALDHHDFMFRTAIDSTAKAGPLLWRGHSGNYLERWCWRPEFASRTEC